MSMRLALLLALALPAAGGLIASCSAGAGDPFASFETRCGRLPGPHYDVAVVPMQVEEVDTRDIAALTAQSKADAARHRTYGLTSVSFGHSTKSELRMIEDRGSGRACGTPTVHAELSMQPVVVYLARELGQEACERAATLAHEQKHVDIYRLMLAESAQRLDGEMPVVLGREVRLAPSAAELKQRFDGDLRAYFARFMTEQQAAMSARQAAVDTDEEYARVARVCAP